MFFCAESVFKRSANVRELYDKPIRKFIAESVIDTNPTGDFRAPLFSHLHFLRHLFKLIFLQGLLLSRKWTNGRTDRELFNDSILDRHGAPNFEKPESRNFWKVISQTIFHWYLVSTIWCIRHLEKPLRSTLPFARLAAATIYSKCRLWSFLTHVAEKHFPANIRIGWNPIKGGNICVWEEGERSISQGSISKSLLQKKLLRKNITAYIAFRAFCILYRRYCNLSIKIIRSTNNDCKSLQQWFRIPKNQ